MNPEGLRAFLLSFPRVTEETPFDEVTAVYKTAGKMFALIDWNVKPLRINLKCEPELAESLRDTFGCVLPGYHMNKKHWNTVFLDGSVVDSQVFEWVQHSFERVLEGMPKGLRSELFSEWKGPSRQEVQTESEQQMMRDNLRRSI